VKLNTMFTIYLGLGSSLGDRERQLSEAITRLDCPSHGLKILELSPIYESPHLGLEPGDDTRYPPHLNCVVKGETTLSPETLLERIRSTENEGGRQRGKKWGPRTIDIDLLLYGNLTYKSNSLIIPHPGIKNRAFVVLPLYDLAPDLILTDGNSLAELRDSPEIQAQQITLWKQPEEVKIYDAITRLKTSL
jgi:2-amino-4-hydroxy-6-hydroxymethyldihydropteridine diphosphokinase